MFYDFKTYSSFFQKNGVLIDQNKREKVIKKEFEKILIKKNLKIEENTKLFEEVINLTDKPNIIECSFDKKFLTLNIKILLG